jgi:hypothetical protein
VNIDYHVEVDHNYYGVPYALGVRKELEARLTLGTRGSALPGPPGGPPRPGLGPRALRHPGGPPQAAGGEWLRNGLAVLLTGRVKMGYAERPLPARNIGAGSASYRSA